MSPAGRLSFIVGQDKMPSFFIMVIGEDLDPPRVTEAFGMRPSSCWRKGDEKTIRVGDSKRVISDSRHEWGGWKRSFPPPKSEPALIKKMLTVGEELMERRSKVRRIGSRSQIFFVSLIQSTSRLQVPPELHQILGSLGICLQIDYWPREESKPIKAAQPGATDNPGDAL